MKRSLRYERKFLETEVLVQEAELIGRLHPAHFREIFPPRYVNSIYFDTPSLSNYTEHINGAAFRNKIRLRWYGDPQGPIKPVLEVKKKRGEVGAKDHYAVDEFNLNEKFCLEEVLDLVQDSAFAARLACLVPSIFIRYRRSYLQSADKNYRLTIDSELTFRTVNGKRYAFRDQYDDRQTIILELKYDVSLDDGADRITKALPFRLTRSSKYTYGLERLGERGS